MIRITVPTADIAAMQSRISAVTRGEIEGDCEASGYEIVIAVNPAFGTEATLRVAGEEIALGSADVAFEQRQTRAI